jgi:sigma-B regulation protein RsbU (phosphoserine phosphatase)
MSAAFLMATTQLLVRTTMARITDPGRCLEEVNRQLCTQVFNGQFVTMQLLVLDSQTGTVELATAGHPPPLLGTEDPDTGQWVLEPLRIEPQLVLGVEAEAAYETERLDLPPDALLLLYTDGAPDVEAPNGRRLGNEGLRQSLPARRPGRATDARALLEAVVNSVNQFRGSQALGDDLTLVAIKRKDAVAAKRPEPVGVVS